MKREARFKNGHVIPARERFPSPSKFGFYGDFFMPKAESIAHARYKEWVDKFSTPYPLKNLLNLQMVKSYLLRMKTKNQGGTGLSYEDNTSRGVARKEGV